MQFTVLIFLKMECSRWNTSSIYCSPKQLNNSIEVQSIITMGNTGTYGLHVEVERIATTEKNNSKCLPSKHSKVLDKYSFGVGQSTYLNFEEGGRVKVSDQLNHNRVNLLKIAFVKEEVNISEPENNLLSFFQKSAFHKKYSKIYSVVSSTAPVGSFSLSMKS